MQGYRDAEVLSEGRRTRVVRARRSGDGLAVILKMPQDAYPDAQTLARYGREKEILDAVGGRGAVRALGLAQDGHRPVLILEEGPAATLEEWLAAPHDLTQRLQVGVSLARALAQIHGQGVIHRDLSPRNILLDPDALEVRLIDFDAASLSGSDAAAPLDLTGTLPYTAPEQTGRLPRGVDQRSDIYALGAVLCEILTGEPPFPGEDALELVHAHLARRPIPPGERIAALPPALSSIVMRCLEKSPEDRYQSARGALSDLSRAQGEWAERATVSDFPLATHDFWGELRVSRKIYGQEEALQEVLDARDAVGDGPQAVLLTGAEGSGKTSLLLEAARRLEEGSALVARGAFRPSVQAVPHWAIVEALDELVGGLLALPDDQLGVWRGCVDAALGDHADLLLGAMPRLCALLGRERDPALPPPGLRRTMREALRRLLGALARPQAPLVLAFDDLHWADEATIRLLELMLLEEPLPGMLLAATLAADAAPEGPVAGFIARARAQDALREAALRPLAESDVADLLADTLQADRPAVRPLAQILAAKTSGHPFFLRHALEDLARAGQIAADAAAGRWTWNLEAVRRMHVTENVGGVLAALAAALPPDDRALLGEAACLGSRFEVEVLAAMRAEDPATTLSRISSLVARGLVERLSESAGWAPGGTACGTPASALFAFAHERIRAAAGDPPQSEQAASLHLRAARALEAVLPQAQIQQRVIELAEHLCAAAPLLDSLEDRLRVARYDLEAADRCWDSGDFPLCLRYARAGTDLLAGTAWEDDYGLALALYVRRMEAEKSCGQIAQCLRTAEQIIAHGRSPQDTLDASALKCNHYAEVGDLGNLVAAAREGLRGFGIALPLDVTRETALAAYEGAWDILRRWAEGGLEEFVRQVSPVRGAETLLGAFSNAYSRNPYWMTYLGAKILEIAQQHLSGGMVFANAIAIIGEFPLQELWRRDAIEEALAAHRLADSAMALGDPRWNVRGNHLLFTVSYFQHWQRPLRSGIALMDSYYEVMRPHPTFGVIADPIRSFLRLATGEDLEIILAAAEAHVAQAQEQGVPTFADVSRRLALAVRALRAGEAAPEALAQISDGTPNAESALVAHYLTCLAALVLDRPQSLPRAPWPGRDASRESTDQLGFLLPESAFVQALSLARRLPAQAGAAEEAELRFLLEAFGTWAEVQPDNYAHKHLLIEAEWERLFGDRYVALDLYDRAIEAAGRDGFPHHQAIACDCAARFHLERGHPRIARPYLEEARYLFGRWGAVGKVALLDRTHGALLGRPAGAAADTRQAAGGPRGSLTAHGPSGGRRDGALSLDLDAVLRTAAAISSEVELTGLLSALLARMIESAGAERGALLMARGGRWVVEAQGEAGGGACVLQHLPMQQADLLQGVVRQVLRTRDVVSLEDASADARYARDSHVRRRAVRSVICFPILRQGGIVAVLYLENNLQGGAFTPERVEFLRLISGQAAISIENALLYEDLDQKVRERTVELEEALAALRRTQEQMVESEKMASLGQLTAGVAHELNNPVNFIAGSTGPLRRDLEELLALLREYEEIFAGNGADPAFQRAARIREEIDVDTVLGEVGQLLQGIDEGARRTAEIVRDLRNFSRLDEDEMKPADVRSGIDATLTLLHKTYEGRIRIVREYGEIPEIECLPGRLNQVFMNLLANAVQAIEGEGEIRISVHRRGEDVEVQIRDTGGGMTEEVRRRIFEPFYTTKGVGVGTGLGLSISFGILERHHAAIHVESAPGEGSTFTIRLPIRQPDPSRED